MNPRSAFARVLIAGALAAFCMSTAPLHAAPAAEPGKMLRVVLPIAETGFDPQATSDVYSQYIERAIFDPLFTYAYLQRPYKMIPNTAAAMPEVRDDGRTWIIRVRPGTYFADDPAFKGKPRELMASDYVYSWKRLLDPRMRSPFAWFLDGKLAGADAALDAARKAGRLDYDAPIEGLRALDRYTLQVKLKEPDFILQGYMSHAAMSAVAREVVEAYGDASGWVMANPVGTGPYRLKDWRRGQQIVLEANPGYREELFPDQGEPGDAALVAAMKGKRLPLIGRIEFSIIEESNPRLLAFDSGDLDLVNVPSDLAPTVLNGDKLNARYADRGVRLERIVQPALQYAYFNMEDPVVGGYTKDRIALRRAIAMGFDHPALIRTVYQGQALPATQPIPPPVAGHDPALRARIPHDPAAAKALLDKFGYVDRDGDGLREQPDGKPLALTMGSATSARDRELDELWKKSMTGLGLRIEFLKQKWPDLLKMGRAGQLQMWRVGWITVYGEGDAFAQLLYSRNIGQSNYARFSLPEYDELYVASRRLPDGPQRNKLYRRMSEIVLAYTPWDLGVYTIENTVVQPWVQGYKKHTFWDWPLKFYDIDPSRRASAP